MAPLPRFYNIPPIILLYLCLLFNPIYAASIKSLTYAALGDSYAAGDGAGSSRLLPNFDIGCGRFTHAYPVLLTNTSRLSIPPHQFKNLACGGASTTTVLSTQVPHTTSSDIVTLTVGGNEIDFFSLMNACIYEWYNPHFPCSYTLLRARRLVESPKFINNFNTLISRTIQTIPPHSTLLVTGYARFFNSSTSQCDNVSFSKKRHPSKHTLLTKSLRTSLNDLVDLINSVIRACAETHGAIYVDIDSLFSTHRFCEEDRVEPSTNNETWFFNVHFPNHNEEEDSSRNQESLVLGPIQDFIDMTRALHPTKKGHEAIADEIVRLLAER